MPPLEWQESWTATHTTSYVPLTIVVDNNLVPAYDSALLAPTVSS